MGWLGDRYSTGASSVSYRHNFLVSFLSYVFGTQGRSIIMTLLIVWTMTVDCSLFDEYF